jgi:hypothetical protein
VKGVKIMNREYPPSQYIKFIKEQIEKIEAEDNILLFAKKMIKVKDEEGINLFWDEEEEEFMRRYVEYTEELVEC